MLRRSACSGSLVNLLDRTMRFLSPIELQGVASPSSARPLHCSSPARVNARDFELLDNYPSVSPHVLVESLAKGYVGLSRAPALCRACCMTDAPVLSRSFYCVGGSMKAPRQEVTGPIFLSEGMCLSLTGAGSKGVEGLAPEPLGVLRLIKPAPDLLVVGTGDEAQRLPAPCYDFLREQGINVEVQDTEHAVGTFNVLTQEDRKVAALLYPLGKLLDEPERDVGSS